jgi:Ca2+-transporting ATPase
MSVWHTLDIPELLIRLNTSHVGLGPKEIASRQQQYGPNEIRGKAGVTALKLLADQFKNFFILLLLFAAVVSIGIAIWEHSIQEMIEGGLIALIVVFIVGVGFFQEYRAEKALDTLRGMLTPFAVVERHGVKQQISARELVPGDIIHMEAGDRVPADSRILETVQLQINESVLTGEAEAIEKNIDPLQGDLLLGDRTNMAFMGTTVTYGKGKAVVVATGMATEFGHIAGQMQAVEEAKTPLQERLDTLGKQIGVGVLGLCIIVFVIGFLTQDIPVLEMFLVAVALAVAAVPEGLPGVVTVALAMGTRRMVARNVIVRTLPAVETLGCTTVICSDKTGTLTHNQMTVKKIFMADEMIDVSGEGYVPEGGFRSQDQDIKANDHPDLALLLSAAALCNNADLNKREGQWTWAGDPTELSLLVAAQKAGLTANQLLKGQPRVGEMPFDSDRKRMATVHRNDQSYAVYVKGAPDILLERCTSVRYHGDLISLTGQEKRRIIKANDALARDAFRVLALAYKVSQEKPTDSYLEEDLIFLGLVAMKDPPREDARQAIEKCHQAGIRTIMITGDHQTTAVAVAREIGFNADASHVITGVDLSKLTDEQFNERVQDIAIYARVTPEHKLRIVAALQAQGHVVAMTGDGVNDAPALKKADIGVAMGITGTDVSKEASDMVLTDDNFASIVGAVEEGRGIYDNIRKFFAYLLSGNLAEVAVVFFSSLWASGPIALTATQILIINLVTDGFPALSLGVDPFEPNAMARPPRSREEPLHYGLRPFILYYPVIVAAVTLGLFYWVYDPAKENVCEAQTVSFLSLAFCEMYQSFAARSTRYPSFKVGLFRNRWLVTAVVGSLILCTGLVYLPVNVPFLNVSLQELVNMVPPSSGVFVLILLLASLGFLYLELAKAWVAREMENGDVHSALRHPFYL